MQTLNQWTCLNEDSMDDRSQRHNLFAPICPDSAAALTSVESPTSTGNPWITSSAVVTPTSSSTSIIHSNAFVQYQEAASGMPGFQSYNYSTRPGFFLPSGYRLVYTPTGSAQSQPATPATPQPGNSSEGTPPGESHYSETNDAPAASS